MKEPIVFFTIVDDQYYYPAGAHIFVNSFKRFHPDIPLVVYRQDMIDKVFKEKKINFYMAKPTFAKLLTDKYECVVNIDCDTIILDRLHEVLENDYTIGAAWNYNQYENMTVEDIPATDYLQAGLVASRNCRFWDIWEKRNLKDAMSFRCKENDTLNLVAYKDPYVQKLTLKIFDKEKNYLGCKSLGQESKMVMKNGRVHLNGEIVRAYHHARGRAFPKLDMDTMQRNFNMNDDVIKYMKQVGYYGQTEYYV